MTHGITHDRPPEPIVEVVLSRAEADALAEALAIAHDRVGLRHPLTARNLADMRAVLALLRAGDALEEVRLALTWPLFHTTLGVARAALYAVLTPGFLQERVSTVEGQALATALEGLDIGALGAAAIGLWMAWQRNDAAVRLN